MNIVSSIILAVAFILLGVNRIINIKKNTEALYEAVRFISSVKNNIRYLSMDYDKLFAMLDDEFGQMEKLLKQTK